MDQENKQLLLVDLCSRLLYGVKFSTLGGGFPFTLKWIDDRNRLNGEVRLENAEIFLRPMSNMTKDELNDFLSLSRQGSSITTMVAKFDLLNKNMFDYRGLIPKGRAIEAPEGMYN